jgi:hypothetical protein
MEDIDRQPHDDDVQYPGGQSRGCEPQKLFEYLGIRAFKHPFSVERIGEADARNPVQRVIQKVLEGGSLHVQKQLSDSGDAPAEKGYHKTDDHVNDQLPVLDHQFLYLFKHYFLTPIL